MSEAELAEILARNPALRVRGLETRKRSSKKAPAGPAPKAKFGSAEEEKFFYEYVQPRLLAGEIVEFELQKKFEIVEAVEYGGHKYGAKVYTPDFFLKFADGAVEVVEVKGSRIKKLQRDYPLRRQLFIIRYCVPNHWKFTEIIINQDKE